MSIRKLCVAGLLIGGGVAAATYSSDLDRYFNPGLGPATETAALSDEDAVPSWATSGRDVTPSEDTSENSEASSPRTSWVLRSAESVEAKESANVPAKAFVEKTRDAPREKESVEETESVDVSAEAIVKNAKDDVAVPSQDEQSEVKTIAKSVEAVESASVPAETFAKRMKDVPVAQPKDNQREVKPLELDGKWRVTRAVHNGSNVPFDRYGMLKIEFDEGKIIIAQGAKREVGKLEASDVGMIGETSFAEVVIAPMEGDKKEIRGFYYHDNGELTLIWGAPGAARPDPTNRDDFAKSRILTLQPVQ